MKVYLLILFTCCFVYSMKAQKASDLGYKLLWSSMGIAGSSNVISAPNGNYKVSQSIGQASVIGTSSNEDYYLRQGYQQPSSKIKIIKEYRTNSLEAIIYPNPFEKTISVSFSEEIESELSFLIFDVSGKIIFSQKYEASQNIELNLEDISQGLYLFKVFSKEKTFTAKLIKI